VAEATVICLQKSFTLGYQPTAVLARHAHEAGQSVGGVPVVGPSDLAGRFAAQGMRVAILVDEADERWSADHLAALQATFPQVLWIHRPGELPLEGLQLKNLGSAVGIEYANQLLLLRNRMLKRTIDIVAGTVLAVVTLPVMALGAALVRLSSRGPLLFAQVREGAGGRPIQVYKLRTMYIDAEARLESTLSQDARFLHEWQARFKLRNDPRIVPVIGRFLRRFSIDELPQLWQVVAGTLSLVGPRPFPPYHLERYTPLALDLRRRVRPGVTGLWQVRANGASDLAHQQSHDVYYVRNWSLWMDLYVLGRTAGIVLLGRGTE
jgi:lipopolysaccharide/colanic/teichoic acid biosynthesis glycosyltransferase